MGSLNSRQLKRARSLCEKRDGRICGLCKAPVPKQIRPDIHHRDGNNKHNPSNGSNWELAHHSCNVKESWIRKRIDVIENIDKDVPFTYRASTRMELSWIKWMIDVIHKEAKIHYRKAINTGALEIDGSQQTVKRYLEKHLSDPDNPKSIFKSIMDGNYETYITFSDHAAEYLA